MSKEEKKTEPFRQYSHKYIQAVTDKHLIRLEDKTEEMPKAEPTISVGPVDDARTSSWSQTMNIKEATELRDALTKVLGAYHE